MDVGSESRAVLENRGGVYHSKKYLEETGASLKYMNDQTSQIGVCTVMSIPDTKSKEDISGESLPSIFFIS